jgi:hypothetical protein
MRNFLFLIILFVSASCSNRFAQISPEVSNQLASINLKFDAESLDIYEFQRHLSSLLNIDSSLEKKYILDIRIDKKQSGLVIQKDADTIRETQELTVYYKLSRTYPSKVIYSGKFRQISSYNTMFSPYSTNLEMMQSSSNLYKTSAEELRRKLIIFFKNNPLFK